MTGSLTALWDAKEKQLLNYSLTYKIRIVIYEKKQKRSFLKKFLSVENNLQHILNELIAIRHQKAKNIQLDNYRDYMFKKYERFDYTADDCYELAESIRQYVVPLTDKILN